MAITNAFPFTPTGPYLLAILLVVKSGSGPRIAYCYPPRPDSAQSYRSENGNGKFKRPSHDASATPTEESGSSSSSAAHMSLPGESPSSFATSPGILDGAGEHGDRICGHTKEGLAKLLTPNSRAWNAQKLELVLADKCYVGCPVYAREDGLWSEESESSAKDTSKEKSSPGASDTLPSATTGLAIELTDSNGIEQNNESTEVNTGDNSRPRTAIQHAPTQPVDVASPPKPGTDQTRLSAIQPGSASGAKTLPQSFASQHSNLSARSEDSGVHPSRGILLFNVVFILKCPPRHEHAFRMDELYRHVVQPISSALHDLQVQTGWLEREVKRMERTSVDVNNSRPDNGDRRRSSEQVLDQPEKQASGLDSSLALLYKAISQDSIAHVKLGPTTPLQKPDSSSRSGQVYLSLQLPQPLNITSFPTPQHPSRLPGLPITGGRLTTSSVVSEAYDRFGIDTTLPTGISQHAAVLLSSNDASTVIKAFNSPPLSHHPLALPLRAFVRYITPNKSILQLSRLLALQRLNLGSIDILETLTCELIRLRFARAIRPLHARAVFVVNANADLSTVHRAADAYEAYFRRISPDVPEFLDVLAQLGKPPDSPLDEDGNVVTHTLQPWLSLIPTQAHKALYMSILDFLVRGAWVMEILTYAYVRIPAAVKRVVDNECAQQNDLAKSVESIDKKSATVPDADSPDASNARQSVPSVPECTLLKDPRKPSNDDRSYLDYIAQHLVTNAIPANTSETSLENSASSSSYVPADEELVSWWDRVHVFFDGKTAIEDLPALLGVKRRDVTAVIDKILRLCVRIESDEAVEPVVSIIRTWG